MSRSRIAKGLAAVALAAGVALGTGGWATGLITAAGMKGPPWISIEYPPSPYDQTTRDAFLLVHAFHHGEPMSYPCTGSAEGLVNGERRSLPLTFTQTSRVGTFALRKQWPAEGTWTLVVRVEQGPDDAATALVDLGADGNVVAVHVPTEQRGSWRVPRQVAMREVDAALRARAAAQVAGR